MKRVLAYNIKIITESFLTGLKLLSAFRNVNCAGTAWSQPAQKCVRHILGWQGKKCVVRFSFFRPKTRAQALKIWACAVAWRNIYILFLFFCL